MCAQLSKLRLIADKAFTKYLFFTNFAMGSAFMFLGDGIAQTLIARNEQRDWQRTKNMGIMGIGFGMLGHNWYKYLDNRFPGKSAKSLKGKLLAECAATPVFAAYTFFAFGSLSGKNMKTCAQDFKTNLPYVCAVDWLVYVPLQAVNFYYFPPKFRFLFVCALTTVYDVFLAWVLNRNTKPKNTLEQSSDSDKKDV